MQIEKTFRPSKYDRQLLWLYVCLLLAMCGVGLVLTHDSRLLWRLLLCGIFGVPMLGCLATIVFSYTSFLTLTPDQMEWRTAFETQRLNRRDVLGWGVKVGQKGKRAIVFRTQYGEQIIISGAWFGISEIVIEDWLSGVPNLEATDEAFSNKALLTNPAFGPLERRSSNIYSHKAFLAVLSGLSGCIALWTLIHDYPPIRTAAVVLPLIVCVLPLISGGRWSYLGRPRDRLPVWPIALGPILVMSLIAYIWFEPANEGPLLLTALGLGTGLLILQKIIDHRASAWILLSFNLIYLFGALTMVNAAYQSAPIQHFEAKVLSKSGGRRGNSATVEPWGPVMKARSFRIGTSTYRAIKRGDRMCMTLYTGALGWQYYHATPCKPTSTPAKP